MLQEPKQGDKRWRYSESERIAIYSKIIKELDGSRPTLQLSAENPNIWDKVGLDKNIIHSGLVYQYSKGDNNADK